MPWSQLYTPLGNLLLSALVAALPVVVLLGMLAFWHVRAHLAALAGLATALLVAIVVYGMPIPLALAAAGNGAAYGLFPIGWIVLSAIFVYDLTVMTGKFEVVKQTIAGLASDRRVQALLIGFSFGAFIEGAAGFGTPVAICAAMLIGLGFKPLPAAGLSLIGNTAPVAFGALGTPIIALAGVTGLSLMDLSAMVGRQLPVFSVIVPFWLVGAMAGRKGMMEVWPACLVSGLAFAIPQYVVSNFYGPSLVDIASAIFSIFFLILLLRFWQPRAIWRFSHESADLDNGPVGTPGTVAGVARRPSSSAAVGGSQHPSRKEAWTAWMPWIILSVLVFLWGVPQFKNYLNSVSIVRVSVPFLDKAVLRTPPVVAAPKAEDAVFTLNWLSATGTGLLLSGILSGLLLGIKPAQLFRTYIKTLMRVRTSLLTIAAMMALGFTTRYGGLDASMGLAFASTGFLFPFFSPMLGWLGVALTGSDTSSNVLFGNLQQISAQQLGISPVLAAASNSSGGVMGKMIDAQSIVVAGVATGQQGGEGDILRYVFFHSVVLAALVGVLVMLQAYVFPWMVPG
ncbi:MAG: lactate permease LctP family transporter [Acidobacteria bacterium]|nr:lactate permease LctP family transporter [Acidobacteriota bacterium]MCI0626411.1 lactate permease LctP family transporter [Acidobacteriota bacterium]MCI0722568.1 lactate permease LctP family transporter [Acidobacteriota bacterium]